MVQPLRLNRLDAGVRRFGPMLDYRLRQHQAFLRTDRPELIAVHAVRFDCEIAAQKAEQRARGIAALCPHVLALRAHCREGDGLKDGNVAAVGPAGGCGDTVQLSRGHLAPVGSATDRVI